MVIFAFYPLIWAHFRFRALKPTFPRQSRIGRTEFIFGQCFMLQQLPNLSALFLWQHQPRSLAQKHKFLPFELWFMDLPFTSFSLSLRFRSIWMTMSTINGLKVRSPVFPLFQLYKIFFTAISNFVVHSIYWWSSKFWRVPLPSIVLSCVWSPIFCRIRLIYKWTVQHRDSCNRNR